MPLNLGECSLTIIEGFALQTLSRSKLLLFRLFRVVHGLSKIFNSRSFYYTYSVKFSQSFTLQLRENFQFCINEINLLQSYSTNQVRNVTKKYHGEVAIPHFSEDLKISNWKLSRDCRINIKKQVNLKNIKNRPSQ